MPCWQTCMRSTHKCFRLAPWRLNHYNKVESFCDVLIGISTSGNSRNVIRAVEEAQKLGIVTIGLLGRDGGQLKSLCDYCIVVPSNDTARIQECHILIGHTLCGLIEQELGLV